MKLQTFVLNPKIRAIDLVLIDQLSFIHPLTEQIHVNHHGTAGTGMWM